MSLATVVRVTARGAHGPVTCKGATEHAAKPCSREASQIVTLRTAVDTGFSDLTTVDTAVQMCDTHATRLRVGARTGRSIVVSKSAI